MAVVAVEVNMSKTATVHFIIEGEWFTWFLRHQWIEGNEEKALKTWDASFPHLSDKKFINGVFLEVVSGQKKFFGENDFELKDDNVKCWSTSQGGKPDKQYPLVDSWQDVLEKKGIELFQAELDLRDCRLNRRYAPTRSGNNHRADKWHFASQENEHENRPRKKAADLLATISNICARTGLKYAPIPIPSEGTLLEDKSKKDTKWPSRKVKHNPSLDNNKRFHAAVIAVLEPVRVKFLKKYGVELVRYNYDEVQLLCGVEEAERWSPHEILTFDESAKAKVKASKSEPMSMAEGLDKAIKQAMEEGDTQRLAMLQGFKNNGLFPGVGAAPSSIIPGLDLDKHIDNLLKADKRTAIEPEDVGTMEWTSGYIAPTGEFYGCPDISHREFSQDLIEKFNLAPKNKEGGYSWLKAKRGESNKPVDPEIVMDRAGWVRVSVNRFFWDPNHCKFTQAQRVVVKDYMNAKKMDKAVFNDPTTTVTFEEGMKRVEEDAA